MNEYKLSKIFLDVFNDLINVKKKKIIKFQVFDYDELETTLQQYLISFLGLSITHTYQDHYPEIRKYFENILVHYNGGSIIDEIRKYELQFQTKIKSHPLSEIFILVMQHLLSRNYDGKISYFDNNVFNSEIDGKLIELADTYISDFENSLIIGRMNRKNEIDLPAVYIQDLAKFEMILKSYVDTVKESDTFYNLFNNENFRNVLDENKVRILLEWTLLNATSRDLVNIENFFLKYTNFVADTTLNDFRKLQYLGNLFDDEVYVMLKRSEISYETPYYFCFMLKNKIVELPNIRFGISNHTGLKTAYIIATQSSQNPVINPKNSNDLAQYLKTIIPPDSRFRFYNPTHLISLLISIGIFKGMGINRIEVVDYLPYRLRKVMVDKKMSEEEGMEFQKRLTDKNIFTYMKLHQVVEGINILNYPGDGLDLMLDITSELKGKNAQLQEIYLLSYQLGEKIQGKKIK